MWMGLYLACCQIDTEIDGGVYEESEQALTVLDVIKDLAESLEYCQLLEEVPNEYAFVDYDELWEEYETMYMQESGVEKLRNGY